MEGFGVGEKCSSDLALNQIHLHLKNHPCGFCTSLSGLGKGRVSFPEEGQRPFLGFTSSAPSLPCSDPTAGLGRAADIWIFLGFGQTHGKTASTCPHPHTGWEKASAQSRDEGEADGVAPAGIKFGLFGFLLGAGCSWQDRVQCQARRRSGIVLNLS